MDERTYLEGIIVPIVSYPDKLMIDVTEDDLGTLITINGDSSDKGLIIGRGGSMIEAIRMLVKVYAIKHQKRISLKVIR